MPRPSPPRFPARWSRLFLCIAASLQAAAWTHAQPVAGADTPPPVRVFILAGQSNMEGKARLTLLDHQLAQPETAEQFAPYHVDGEYAVRDDVWINYLGRRGGLTPGYGSRDRFGVELSFGWRMGDAFDEPVLLIKAAWGGRSLVRDFCPPSAMPDDATIRAELEQENERHRANERGEVSFEEAKARYGASYRAMLDEVRATLGALDERFPALAGRPVELAGLVWFQGWNDQYNGYEQRHEAALAHFVRDVRSDLDAPGLPMVIGVMGQNGSRPADGPMLVIQQAQEAVAAMPEFAGTVRAVRTDELIDTVAEAAYPTWRDDTEAWERVGSDHPYHYLGSAVWFERMGDAFADAMLEMLSHAGG